MRALLACLVALSLTALSPQPAAACGGFFCSTAPVTQAAERVLYAYEADGSLTMAVEVTYAGFDDDFAWILPVLEVPEISLGTSAMFDAVERASRPTFPLSERTDGTCRLHPRCVDEDGYELRASSCGDAMTVFGPETFVDTPGETAPPLVPPPTGTEMMGVTVYAEGPIGPYETVVLSATSAEEVMTWLRERGYRLPVQTAPLLEPYVTEGYRFVALRLSPQRVSNVLRPIILRTPAPAEGEVEACLPIRLTAVAAAPALPIIAFFLGEELVTARNYSLAEPDLTSQALFRSPAAYPAAVAAAADALGGQAFAVDYAGRMPRLTVPHPSVLDLATETNILRFFAALRGRGYDGDPLFFEAIARGLTPPEGVEPTSYFRCVTSSSLSCAAPAHFDPAAIVAAIDAELTRPRAEAEALLRRHLRLTRLSTELSPAEMTLDPVFVRDAGLPEMSNRHPGTLVRQCSELYFREDAPVVLELPGAAASIWQTGVATTNAAYCARYGATVSDGRVASGTAAECGYSCSATGGRPETAWAILLALGLVLWRARGVKPSNGGAPH